MVIKPIPVTEGASSLAREMGWWINKGELEKTLESSLDYMEFKPVNLSRNQPWTLIGRPDAEAEAPALWPPGVKSWPTGNTHNKK